MSDRTPFDALAADGMIASRATYYAALYPRLREVAYQHGYALALHGSLAKDLDVIAVPWVENARPVEVLVAALCERAHGLIQPGTHPKMKPHGRQAWTIHLVGGAGYVDLSVVPSVGDSSATVPPLDDETGAAFANAMAWPE